MIKKNRAIETVDSSVFLADGARVVGDVVIGPDSSVWYNAVIRGDEGQITIGAGSNIQDNVVIHTDPGHSVRIGDGVSVGHSAILHGCCVGDNTVIGMGAIVLNDARIGRDCIIGAGALVTGRTVIPDGSMAFGSPAKVIRPLTPAEIAANRENAKTYRRLSLVHADRTPSV